MPGTFDDEKHYRCLFVSQSIPLVATFPRCKPSRLEERRYSRDAKEALMDRRSGRLLMKYEEADM